MASGALVDSLERSVDVSFVSSLKGGGILFDIRGYACVDVGHPGVDHPQLGHRLACMSYPAWNADGT